jgi:hypothetical protein
MTLQGGDALRARLMAVGGAFEPIGYEWAKGSVHLMKARVHSPTGQLRKSIEGEAGALFAAIYADYRVTFQDKGTKEHDIAPKRDSGSKRGGIGTARAVGYGYGTDRAFFRRRVHVRGIRKRPFIRKSAREAYKNTDGVAEIVAAWNAAGGRGGRYVLGDIKARRSRRTRKVR